MAVTATGEKSGTFSSFVANIRETVRSKFVPESEKAVYDRTTGVASGGTIQSTSPSGTTIKTPSGTTETFSRRDGVSTGFRPDVDAYLRTGLGEFKPTNRELRQFRAERIRQEAEKAARQKAAVERAAREKAAEQATKRQEKQRRDAVVSGRGEPRKQETVTKRTLLPEKQAPIRAIDFERRDGSSGAVVIRGQRPGQTQFSRADLQDIEFESKQRSSGELLFGGGGQTQRIEVPDEILARERERQASEDIQKGKFGTRVTTQAEIKVRSLESLRAAEDERIRQERIRVIEERKQKSPGERIKEAYQSTGKTQFGEPSIRGGIRAGIEAVDVALDTTGINKAIQERFPTFARTPVSTRVVEDIAISGFFAPVFPTTSQIEKQLFEVSRVQSAGVTSTTKEGITYSRAGFKVQRAGRTVKGAVEARSKVVGTNQKGVNAIITKARGGTFSRGIRFPTGREVIRPTSRFQTQEISFAVQKTQGTFSGGIGRVIVRGKGQGVNLYRSAGYSKRVGDYIASFGLSRGAGDPGAISAGVFRVAGSRGSEVSGIISSPTTRLSNRAVEESIKSIVRSSVRIPPQQLITFVPAVSPQVASPSEEIIIKPTSGQQISTQKQELDKSVSSRQIPSSVQTPKETQRQIAPSRSGSAQRQVSTPRNIQEEIQKQVPRQDARLKTDQRIIQTSQTQPLQTQLRTRPRTPFFNIPRLPTPRKRPIATLQKFKPVKQPKPTSGKFPVLVRRFGEFRVAGLGRTPGEAVSIGKNIVDRTLAATFKVPSYKGTSIKGFRTKREKGGIVFIEPRRRRLERGSGEIPEIQDFLEKSLKPKKKKPSTKSKRR